jgi:RHS repeat-associated protein
MDCARASYGYDVYNRLTSAGSATLAYDPVGRLYQSVGGGVTTRFLYDGLDAIAEYNASNVMQRRFVHGPGVDEPLVWYEGAGTSDRRWLVQDQLGSVIAVSNSAGAALSTNTYDEYGIPGASNTGRFQYTGQIWLPDANLYHYRARAYAPALGRFLQSDPILYAGGMNLYAYVGSDPVNWVDPSGTRVFLVSRTAVGIGRHTFVVVAPGLGVPGQLFSYGPSSADIGAVAAGNSLLAPSLTSPDDTFADDARVWANQSWNAVVELDVSDHDAGVAGAATNDLVVGAACTYDFTGNEGCNSNGATHALLAMLGLANMRDPGFFSFTPGWDTWFRLFSNSGNSSRPVIGSVAPSCTRQANGDTWCDPGYTTAPSGLGGSSTAGSSTGSGSSSICRRMPRCPGGR